MKWIGILILCMVASLILMILSLTGKEHKWSALILTFFTLTGILYGLVLAVMFGVSLIIRG